MTSKPLFRNNFILRRSRVANFADMIKIASMFIKTTFKDLKKIKELENTNLNAIYNRASWYNKSC